MLDTWRIAKIIADANVGVLSRLRISEDLAKLISEEDEAFDAERFVFIATNGVFGKS